MSKDVVIDIQGLNVAFDKENVVRNISFKVHKNEILGLVGESGSGKSITSLAMTGLLPRNARVSGHIFFSRYDIAQMKSRELRKLRGNKIAMIFQEPMSSLNPSMKCGKQVAEMIAQHQDLSTKAIKKQVLVRASETPGSGTDPSVVSTSDQRWTKTAGDDRDGDSLQAGPTDRR